MPKRQDREPQAKNSSMFVRLRLVLAFALVILTVSIGYYYLHVQRKSDYLMSRNFRLLTSMGVRIESSVGGQGRVLKHLSEKKDFMAAARGERRRGKEGEAHAQRKNEILKVLAPQFDSVKVSDQKAPEAGVKAWHRTSTGPEGPTFKFFHVAKDGTVLEGEVKLERLVERSLASHEALESVLLADSEGEVVYQKGLHNLGITHLSALTESDNEDKRDRGGPGSRASGLLFGASEHREGVRVAGKRYRLFVEPFSLPIQAPGDEKKAAAAGHKETWLLCGLIPEKEQVYKSMAVSSALLMLLLGGLLLAVLSWPFLKLRLLGDRQRVRLLDVGLVGVCSLAGASIATLTLLDMFAFHRFNGQAEAQVEKLAGEMEERLFAEIFKAYEHLEALESMAKGTKEKPLDLEAPENIERASEPFDRKAAYPFWDNFTLIDKSGMQKVKWSTSSVVSTLIPVRERPYFQRVRDQDLWHLERGGKEIALYVQSIVSSTRGNKLVALAKPSALEGFAASMLTISMPSLIDPVLPPGFGFVVIDIEEGSGKVLFHSDSERNLTESFFAETDQDRRLRSAVFAKRSETMDLRYWGRDYIARVEPVDGLPWAIVALREKELLRAVNLEWIVTTISFILAYMGLLGAVLLVVVAVRPSYRASWLWPDRSRDYLVLSSVLLVLVLAFGLAIWLLPGGSDLFAVSMTLPFAALVTAYLRLGRPIHQTGRNVALLCGGALLVLSASLLLGGSLDADRRPGLRPLIVVLVAVSLALAAKLPRRGGNGRTVSPAQSRYAAAAVLLLLLTAVLPTLGFFESARRIQFESFVKHGQLRLALSLQERARRIQRDARRDRYKEPEKGSGEDEGWKAFVQHRLAVSTLPEEVPVKLRGLDVYAAPFYDTRVTLLKGSPERKSAIRGEKCPCDPEGEPSLLAEIFEERLPRASESSVELRELLHGASSDCDWNWLKGSAGGGLGLYRTAYPEGGLALVSLQNRNRPEETGEFPAFMAGLPLLALLVWLVGFISRNVFLLDPSDPAWPASGRGPSRPGLREFIVDRSGEWTPAEPCFEIDLCALRDGPPESGDRWRRLSRSARGQDVLIRGLDDILEDEGFQGEVLEFLEKLVEKHQNRIVILSKTSSARLFPSSGRNGKGGPSETEERWRTLISAFDVVNANRATQESPINNLHDVLKEECGLNSDLLDLVTRRLKHLNASAKVTPEQVLEELGEVAEGYYQSLWASCSPQEEVVLEHLAEDGFVSERNRRTVRRLIARGLVRREPHLRLMNETFRRFVVSSICKSQVRAVEQDAEPSAWDRLRVPLFLGLAAGLLFVLTTQQSLLDGSVGTVAGVAAGVPALLNMMELFGGRFPGMK